ncbi:GcrA cell cycle regulator [Bradyrhizobium sp. LA8.1]|uniref:GcrA family cell cycle regulator n=1 Tax=unclassified Bradyrhizobium TaxID=2631580 RepID=UPI00339B18B8
MGVWTSTWSVEMVSDLRRLWDRGDTSSQIGKHLGVSRSAVIGKAHRLGLASRAKASHPAPNAALIEERRRQKNTSRAEGARKARQDKRGFPTGERTPPMEIVDLPVHREALSIPFGDLRPWSGNASNECRFIAAEPAGPDYIACGKPTAQGESWCRACKRVVFNYQPTNVIPLVRKQARAA